MGLAVFLFFLACFHAVWGYSIPICILALVCSLCGAYRCHLNGDDVRTGAWLGLKVAAITVLVLVPAGITVVMASQW